MTFNISVSTQPPVVVIAPAGELDLAAASSLRSAITRALDAGPRVVRVDLRALTFVDAAGLQALARSRAEAAVRGAEIEITGWSGTLDRVAVGTTTWSVLRDVPSVDA